MRSDRLTGISIATGVLIAGVLVHRTLWSGADGPVGDLPGFPPERTTAVSELQAYVDAEFGFSLAIPAGWQPVVTARTGVGAAMYEPGYAIGFEPEERGDGVLSDYLMVEILPGDESGLFDTDGRLGRAIRIDGRSAWRDELVLDMAGSVPPAPGPSGRTDLPASVGSREDAAVELVVRQASFSGLGFTVGLYAVGVRSRRTVMAEAFEIMLRTFRLPREPFDVS